jgi:drug/metabolite transporter (DMT)-like permease
MQSIGLKSSDIIKLLLLGAIWGSSFMFMKILVPVFGPIVTANLRIAIACLFLMILFYAQNYPWHLKKFWKVYFTIGLFNSAIPFCLFCYASQYIPASYSAILNSTTPFFGALLSYLIFKDKLSPLKISGMLLGTFGVGLVVNVTSLDTHSYTTLFALLSCLGASFCYAVASIFIKKFSSTASPKGIAVGSQFMAGLTLLPLSLLQNQAVHLEDIHLNVILSLLTISVICSAVAYLIFYELIAKIGPTKSLTVTFLMPFFGIMWSILFLKEILTLKMILGGAAILLGTGLVLKKQ